MLKQQLLTVLCILSTLQQSNAITLTLVGDNHKEKCYDDA